MTADLDATLLGTGDAFATPRPGCRCPQCVEARADARQARTRSGMLVRSGAEVVLLDCSPDILRQLDRVGVRPDEITRVVISHQHNDHCYGLYDLARTRTLGGPPVRVHANDGTEDVLQRAFPGCFKPDGPLVVLDRWGTDTRLALDGLVLEGVETHHYPGMETTAFLLTFTRGDVTRRVLHATDMGTDVPSPQARIEGVDLFLCDGTYLGGGGRGHPGTDRAVEIGRAIGARRIAITHVGHWGLTAAEAAARVPAGVAICRDGDALAPLLP